MLSRERSRTQPLKRREDPGRIFRRRSAGSWLHRGREYERGLPWEISRMGRVPGSPVSTGAGVQRIPLSPSYGTRWSTLPAKIVHRDVKRESGASRSLPFPYVLLLMKVCAVDALEDPYGHWGCTGKRRSGSCSEHLKDRTARAPLPEEGERGSFAVCAPCVPAASSISLTSMGAEGFEPRAYNSTNHWTTKLYLLMCVPLCVVHEFSNDPTACHFLVMGRMEHLDRF
jgi:hypothetical protein